MGFVKSAIGAAAVLLAASSRGAVIAYDDFAENGDLDGSAGGAGFTNAWAGGAYTVSGGVANGTGNSLRGLEYELGSNGTVWVSFDFGVESAVSSYGGLSFFDGDTERLIIGDWWRQSYWSMDPKTGTRATSDIAILGYRTGVAKITLGAGATSIVELWVGENADDVVDCSGAADLTVSGATLAGVDTLRVGAGFFMNFGDLVLGETAEDVGAIAGGTDFAADTTGAWTNEANWSAGVPTAADNASILFGADVTVDTAASALTLTVKDSAALRVADGAELSTGSDVTFGSGTILTVGMGSGTSSGQLTVGGMLDLGGASLVVDGVIDGDGRTIATAAGGLVGEFSNYSEESLVRSGDINYFIHYVTNASPNYIVINTNGPVVDPVPPLPPRPEELLIVDGFDQRYMAYDYDLVTGTWTDSVSAAQNAAAVNVTDFTITTSPNGRPAVFNMGLNGDGTSMSFTRASALSETGFTIQAVIRVDGGNTDSRQGPFGLAETSGWSGLFMGARAGDTSKVRAGNIGNGGSATVLEAEAANSLSTNVWGIYTLVVDLNATDQMTATFDLLEDGSNGFTITDTTTSITNIAGIGTAGGLFAGERGGGLEASDNWQGVIADLVVYNRALDASELAANLEAFQTIYQDAIDAAVGSVAIEMVSGGAEVVVSFETSVAGTYALESTDNLANGAWSDVETGISGTGGEVSVTVPVSGDADFFRAYIEDGE